ncbi:hypothetical protein BJX96DRAFT_67552 [Aspergillus floccosus]
MPAVLSPSSPVPLQTQPDGIDTSRKSQIPSATNGRQHKAGPHQPGTIAYPRLKDTCMPRQTGPAGKNSTRKKNLLEPDFASARSKQQKQYGDCASCLAEERPPKRCGPPAQREWPGTNRNTRPGTTFWVSGCVWRRSQPNFIFRSDRIHLFCTSTVTSRTGYCVMGVQMVELISPFLLPAGT